MQNDINEFVFKRRRKRLRTLDVQEAVLPDQVSGAQLHSRSIPEIAQAVLSEPVTSSSTFPDNPVPPSLEAPPENIVTVERFLRYSAQTSPKSGQAVSGAVTQRKSRAYTHHRSAERRTTRVRKSTKMPRGAREPSRISKTLFQAAVLTDGDPLDTLVGDAGVSLTRRPLKFVTFNKFASHIKPGQTALIEPSDLGRRGDVMPHTRHCGNVSDHKQRHTSHRRVPLYLVPLQEAEAAYSVMFPSRHM